NYPRATKPRADCNKGKKVRKIIDLNRVVAAPQAEHAHDGKREKEEARELDDVIQPVATAVTHGEGDDPHTGKKSSAGKRFCRPHTDKVQLDTLRNQVLDIPPQQGRIGIRMLTDQQHAPGRRASSLRQKGAELRQRRRPGGAEIFLKTKALLCKPATLLVGLVDGPGNAGGIVRREQGRITEPFAHAGKVGKHQWSSKPDGFER